MIGVTVFLLIFVVLLIAFGSLEMGNFSDQQATQGEFVDDRKRICSQPKLIKFENVAHYVQYEKAEALRDIIRDL